MSKFFNDARKAHQWAQQKLAEQDLDVEQMLEALKQGPAHEPQIAPVPVSQLRRITVRNENGSRLVLCQDDSSQAALEAYRGLRTRLMRVQAKSGLRTIAITSTLPGEGKTLTTMNLGLCFEQLAEQRVLVIDGDLRTCGLSSLLDQPSTIGLAEVLTGQATLDEAIVATGQRNLFVLPAGTVSSSPAELFTGPRWQEFLAHCGERFKVILIDTPPILPLADFELISSACDGVVLVVRAHHVRRDLLQKTVKALDPQKFLGVVLNATEAGVKPYYNYGHR